MKTLMKHMLLATLVSLFLFNCSKDDDGDVDTLTPPPQPENIRLKTYSFDSTDYQIVYNEDGQVTNYGNILDNPGNVVYNSNNKVIQLGVYSFTYNAQGRISEITMADTNSYRNQKTNLTYNNNGLVAYQTLRYTNINSGTTSIIEKTFEYNNNNQLISITEEGLNNTGYIRNVLSYDSNGNVSEDIRQSSSDGVSYYTLHTQNYVYDTKKNPSKQILSSLGATSNFSMYYMSSLYTRSIGNSSFFRISYYSNNNVISYQYIDDFGSTNNKTYTYVYNDKDYPTSVEIYNTFSSGTNSTSYRTWTYETY